MITSLMTKRKAPTTPAAKAPDDETQLTQQIAALRERDKALADEWREEARGLGGSIPIAPQLGHPELATRLRELFSGTERKHNPDHPRLVPDSNRAAGHRRGAR